MASANVLQAGDPSCSSGTFDTPYVACAGSFSGNLTDNLSQDQIDTLNAAFGSAGFQYKESMLYSKSDAGDHGAFTDVGDDFSLDFDPGTAATVLFVIGLKQSNRFSLYLLDGGTAGISSVSFDVNGGVVMKQTDGLSTRATSAVRRALHSRCRNPHQWPCCLPALASSACRPVEAVSD